MSLPLSGHTRHSSLTKQLHLEDEVTLPGTSSRQIIERITYLNKMAYRIGQLGVVRWVCEHFHIQIHKSHHTKTLRKL